MSRYVVRNVGEYLGHIGGYCDHKIDDAHVFTDRALALQQINERDLAIVGREVFEVTYALKWKQPASWGPQSPLTTHYSESAGWTTRGKSTRFATPAAARAIRSQFPWDPKTHPVAHAVVVRLLKKVG